MFHSKQEVDRQPFCGMLIIDQSENFPPFSLLFLSNQITVFTVVLDTSYFKVGPRLARLQPRQEHSLVVSLGL